IITGIQLFMSAYALIYFFETPSEKRQGRALYLISGWLIFAFYTVGACTDLASVFQDLLGASDGLEYNAIDLDTWIKTLSKITSCIVYLVGDGLLLYRCYLLLAGAWLWLLVLPVLMYMSVIALHIFASVTVLKRTENMVDAIISADISVHILTFTTNLLITTILCYRLISAHRHFARSMPSATKRLSVYRTAMRILVESALPLALVGLINTIIVLIPFTSSNNDITSYNGDPKALTVAYITFELLYYALQALAPQMLIFRVTTGRSWVKTDKSSAEALSRSLAFNNGPQQDESNVTGQFTRDGEGGIAEQRRSSSEAAPSIRFKE
ncbi:hypothetical protein FA15DRAFT_603133, partial [Coprinopsis marcescibilis]